MLSTGNLADFLSEALGSYFQYNLALAIFLAVLAYFHYHSQVQLRRWALIANSVLQNKALAGLIWALLFLGIARALFFGFDTKTVPVLDPQVAVDLRTTSTVSLPIELVYADKGRLSDIFGQIQGDLKLTEQKVSQKDSVEAEAGGALGPASLKAKNAKEAERSSTFTHVEPNDPVKIVRTIEYLTQKQKLLVVRSIELQSSDIKEFESAVELLASKHSLSLPKATIEARRRELIELNLKQSAPKQFAVGSWVLIDGTVQTTQNTTTKVAQLKFEYVPSLPSRVTFACAVPYGELRSVNILQGKDAPALKMRIFGTIAAMNATGPNVQYLLTCYAAFR